MIEQLELDSLSAPMYAINDNASNMQKSIRESRYLQQYLCDIHTLQLGVEDTFAEVDGMAEVLKKCKALAKLTHTSTTVAYQQLKSQCTKLGVRFRKLKNPNSTRWNSAYTNMDSILLLKTVLQSLFEDDETNTWPSFALTVSEWKLIQGAVTVLKPFLLVTKSWEAEKTPTINLVIERIYTLHETLNGFIVNRSNCRFSLISLIFVIIIIIIISLSFGLFPTVCLQMYHQMACQRGCIVTLVAFV